MSKKLPLHKLILLNMEDQVLAINKIPSKIHITFQQLQLFGDMLEKGILPKQALPAVRAKIHEMLNSIRLTSRTRPTWSYLNELAKKI